MTDEESIINIKGIFVDHETLRRHVLLRSYPSNDFLNLIDKILASRTRPDFYASVRSYGTVSAYLEKINPQLLDRFQNSFSRIYPSQVESWCEALICHDINSEENRNSNKLVYTLEMFLARWNLAKTNNLNSPQNNEAIQGLLLKNLVQAKEKFSLPDVLVLTIALLIVGNVIKNESDKIAQIYDDILVSIEHGFYNSIALIPLHDREPGFAKKYFSAIIGNQGLILESDGVGEDKNLFPVANAEENLTDPLLLNTFAFLSGTASNIFGQIRKYGSDDFSYEALLSNLLKRTVASTILDGLDGPLPLLPLYLGPLVQSYMPEGYTEIKLESLFPNNSREIELFTSSNIDDIAIENLISVFSISESLSRSLEESLGEPLESQEEPLVFPIKPLEEPVSLAIESVEEQIVNTKEIEPKKNLNPVDSVSKPVLVEVALDFSGGNNKFVIREDFSSIRIDNFGGVGRGTDPDSKTLNELDTLKFEGDKFTVENIVFDQNGENLLISFSGLPSFFVELVNFKLELLDNIPFVYQDSQYIGNIIFGGEFAVLDSYDIVNNDDILKKPFGGNKLTVFNDLDNSISGQGDSNNIFHGQGGNDVLTGSFGDDTLRGGEGNDILDGGAGLNHLYGGPGKDKFVLNANGFSRIYDFTSEDLLVLPSNISLKDVDIYSQGSSDASNSDSLSTFIAIRSTNKVIGEFVGVNPLSVNWESTIES